MADEKLQEKKDIMPSTQSEYLTNEYLKKKYKESLSEIQKKEEEEFKKNLGNNINLLKRLEGTPYNFTSQGLRGINEEQEKLEKISNLLAIPIKQYNYITEEKIESFIEIKCFIAPTGEELPSIIIPLKQIENGNWFLEPVLGLRVRFELPPQKSKQIDCLKRLSEYMEIETIYQYTGYTEIDGKQVFLHHGGAVGLDKPIRVELGDEVLNKYAFTDKDFELKQCLNYTFQCLETAPEIITIPILALIFMAPLSSTFEKLGIPVGFLMWVLGPQQCKKTSLVSAFISHFGNFNKNLAPMNFLDGMPSIIEKSARLKDVPILCDDYYPSSNKQEASEMNKNAEKLISLSADKMTGARSKSNGKMRKTYRAKGQIIATGELFPDLSQSRISRVLFINIKKLDIKGKELKKIQEHPEELQYSMKEYIKYICKNIDDIKVEIPVIFDTKIQEASEEVTFRTAEMLAGLYIGYSILMNFAHANDVITEEEKEKLLSEGWNILIKLGKEQNAMVETVSPMNMLLSAIETLSFTENISTFNYEDSKLTKMQDIMQQGFIRLL